MKIGSPVPLKKARIEIIPLIDIMFFLLACFMLVSLSMIQMRGMKVALPSADSVVPEMRQDFHAITLDALGQLFWEKEAVTKEEMLVRARAAHAKDAEARFYIRADQNALHGDVIGVLDRLKSAGIQRVALELKAQSVSPSAGKEGSAPAP
jgi:biopolymer transport protein ExbD